MTTTTRAPPRMTAAYVDQVNILHDLVEDTKTTLVTSSTCELFPARFSEVATSSALDRSVKQ